MTDYEKLKAVFDEVGVEYGEQDCSDYEYIFVNELLTFKNKSLVDND